MKGLLAISKLFIALLIAFIDGSCQTIPKRVEPSKIICEIEKTDRIKSYSAGSVNEDLVLTLRIDSLITSDPRARVRIFVNLLEANIHTSIEDSHYLGGISNFPSGSGQQNYIFNFSRFLDRFPVKEGRKILNGNIYLIFVAVPFEKGSKSVSLRTMVTSCVLDISQ